MSTPVVVDTSILIDHLRGEAAATELLRHAFKAGRRVTGSVMTKVEVMAGMRSREEDATRALLGIVEWTPVSEELADLAGSLASDYSRSHSGVDPVDYVIAATVAQLGAELWTRNVRHFPMFSDLAAPY